MGSIVQASSHVGTAISIILWLIWAGMNGSINNCSTSYGAVSSSAGCYTSPLFTAATTTVYGFNFSYILLEFSWVMVICMGLLLVVRMWMFFTQFLGRGYNDYHLFSPELAEDAS